MKKLISCEFNIDTACVELKYSDGSMLSINCNAVEDEVANSRSRRFELDWLIYNDPLSYAEWILNVDPDEYLRTVMGTLQLDRDFFLLFNNLVFCISTDFFRLSFSMESQYTEAEPTSSPFC